MHNYAAKYIHAILNITALASILAQLCRNREERGQRSWYTSFIQCIWVLCQRKMLKTGTSETITEAQNYSPLSHLCHDVI